MARPDQAEAVQRIVECKAGEWRLKDEMKDYYAMIGVEKDADEDTLTKAYRKMSTRIHPDKNPHPGAQEAFKALGTAYKTLKDPMSRKEFDEHGADGPPEMSGEKVAVEIFQVFDSLFANGGLFSIFPSDYQWARRPPPQHADRAGWDGAHRGGSLRPQAAMLLPLLLLLLAAAACACGLCAACTAPEPEFALSPTREGGLVSPLRAGGDGAPYFVSRDTAAAHPDRDAWLQRTERRVAAARAAALRDACRAEWAKRAALRRRAEWYHAGDRRRELIDEADSMPLTACSGLESLLRRWAPRAGGTD